MREDSDRADIVIAHMMPRFRKISLKEHLHISMKAAAQAENDAFHGYRHARGLPSNIVAYRESACNITKYSARLFSASRHTHMHHSIFVHALLVAVAAIQAHCFATMPPSLRDRRLSDDHQARPSFRVSIPQLAPAFFSPISISGSTARFIIAAPQRAPPRRVMA